MSWIKSNTGGLQLDHMVSLLKQEDLTKYKTMVAEGVDYELIIVYLGETIRCYYETGVIK